jgi:hypothetical protein
MLQKPKDHIVTDDIHIIVDNAIIKSSLFLLINTLISTTSEMITESGPAIMKRNP